MDDFLAFGWFFVALGLPFGLLGLAAWTGRYRGWVYLGRGYRVLAMLPLGFGLTALGLAPLLPTPIGMALGGLGMLGLLAVGVMLVLTLFMKDRWYPRWYHKMPGRQW